MTTKTKTRKRPRPGHGAKALYLQLLASTDTLYDDGDFPAFRARQKALWAAVVENPAVQQRVLRMLRERMPTLGA